MEHTQVHQLPLLPQHLCILLLRHLSHNMNDTSFQRIQHLKQIQGQHKYNDNLLIPTSFMFNICTQRDMIIPFFFVNSFPQWQEHTDICSIWVQDICSIWVNTEALTATATDFFICCNTNVTVYDYQKKNFKKNFSSMRLNI